MAFLLFLVFVLAELGFAFFCIRLRATQQKARAILRFCYLGSFLLLVALRIVFWNFRWYAFAFLLIVWAMMGFVSLLRHPKKQKAYSTAKTFLRGALCVLLVFITLIPALVFVPYQPLPPTGKLAVATAQFTFTDETRKEVYGPQNQNRTLTTTFWYPENAGNQTYPLVLFSHGSLGVRTSNESLYIELASHGYVVCAIDHTYFCLYTQDNAGKITLFSNTFKKEVATEGPKIDPHQSFALYQKWMSVLTRDIAFVLDKTTRPAQSQAAPFDRVDANRVGVMGHSLGGAAALNAARTLPGIHAAVALESPYLGDITGVNNQDFVWNQAPFPVPTLNIYSDASWPFLKDWVQYAQNAKFLSDTPRTTNVHIPGAGHLTLTDLALSSPFLASVMDTHKPSIDAKTCLTQINQECLAFLNQHLKTV